MGQCQPGRRRLRACACVRSCIRIRAFGRAGVRWVISRFWSVRVGEGQDRARTWRPGGGRTTHPAMLILCVFQRQSPRSNAARCRCGGVVVVVAPWHMNIVVKNK